MKLLADIHDRHPLFVGLAGAASGFSGLILDHLAEVNTVVAFIGTVAGAAAACLTFALKFGSWWKRRKYGPFSDIRHPHDWQGDDVPWFH